MNNDDGYEYVFTDKDAIKLREGSYTLTLGGDFLALPYKVKSGNTVTVKGAELGLGPLGTNLPFVASIAKPL